MNRKDLFNKKIEKIKEDINKYHKLIYFYEENKLKLEMLTQHYGFSGVGYQCFRSRSHTVIRNHNKTKNFLDDYNDIKNNYNMNRSKYGCIHVSTNVYLLPNYLLDEISQEAIWSITKDMNYDLMNIDMNIRKCNEQVVFESAKQILEPYLCDDLLNYILYYYVIDDVDILSISARERSSGGLC